LGFWLSTGLRNWNLAATLAFGAYAHHDNVKHDRAERLFKTREEQKADAPKATAEYYAASTEASRTDSGAEAIATGARVTNEIAICLVQDSHATARIFNAETFWYIAWQCCAVCASAGCGDRWFRVAGGVMLKQSPEKPVRNRIDLSTKELARHWCKHIGVSQEELESAMAKVGDNVETVMKELSASKGIPRENWA
jgi:hypothetical protein